VVRICRLVDWLIRDTVEIQLHLKNKNREDGFSVNISWKPLSHSLAEEDSRRCSIVVTSSGDQKKGSYSTN
jgi:hypothetical protein